MSVWEQRQYDALLVSWQASQGREQQPSVAVCSIWETLYKSKFNSMPSPGRNCNSLLNNHLLIDCCCNGGWFKSCIEVSNRNVSLLVLLGIILLDVYVYQFFN